MAESTQHKLSRIRPPRVQITYDVEIGNAIEMKELPFVLGIMADLSGMPAVALPKMKERKFVDISRDNFSDIISSIKPRLALRVANTLVGDGSETNVELKFSDIEDFNPLNIVKNVPALNKLYSIRSHLKDMLTKLDGNDELEALLKEIMKTPEVKDAVKAGLTPVEEPAEEAPAEGGEAPPEGGGEAPAEETPATEG